MFKSSDPPTQNDKRSVIDRFAEAAADLPYKKYRREDMERSQQARAATPGAADKLVKVRRAVSNWAISQKPPLMLDMLHSPQGALSISGANRIAA